MSILAGSAFYACVTQAKHSKYMQRVQHSTEVWYPTLLDCYVTGHSAGSKVDAGLHDSGEKVLRFMPFSNGA